MGQAGSSLVVSVEMRKKEIEARCGNGRFLGWKDVSIIFSNPNLWTKDTQPKTNMEPQNGGLQDDFPLQKGDFQVLC